MKKYLINGLLALFVGGFAASCADKDVDYVPLDQQKATAYADAFKELIGGEVAPDHDWGFTKTSLVDESTSQTRAQTRATNENANIWEKDGYVIPADITEDEIAAVRAVFDQKGAESYTSLIDWDCYFVQQVYKGEATYTAESGGSVTGSEHMDWLCSVTNKTLNYNTWPPEVVYGDYYDEHIPKFNNGHCTMDATSETSGKHIFDLALMTNSNTTKFGFKSSEDNGTVFYNFRMEKINGNYYVGFDFEAAGDNEANANERVARDYIYNDWIVKIVPGDGIIPGGGSTSTSTRTDRVERWRLVQQGRIFCEDLGTTDITTSDIDFNDAVFDAKLWRVGQFDVYYTNNESREGDYIAGLYNNEKENGKFKYVAEILLLAAGGTMPLKIGGDDGFEIHSKFGEGQEPSRTIGHTTIINTMGQPSQANFSTTVNTDNECKAVRVFVDVTKYVVEILNPEDPEIGLDVIPIDVKWNTPDHQAVGELTANYGDVPQKLCVPIGTRWVYERIPITSAYKQFDSYAKTNKTERTDFWDGTKEESLLYPSSPEGMTPEAVCTNEIGSNSYKDYTTTGETTTEVETVLWEGEVRFATSAQNGSSSDEYTLYSKDFNVGDYIRVYGEAYGSDPWVTLHDGLADPWVSYAGCSVPGAGATNQYTDIYVTQDIIDKMTLIIGLWGKDCTVTKICKVVRTTN